MDAEFLTKETIVAGERMVLFSLDSVRWFSRQSDAIQDENARADFWQQNKRSLNRSGTFLGSGNRGEHRGRKKPDDEAKDQRRRSFEGTENSF
jgi:hypothetical protein